MVRDSEHTVTTRRCRRQSIPGADYFLSLQTFDRAPGLEHASVAAVLLAEAKAMAGDGTWVLRSASVMPDHLHLVMTLGHRLTLGRCVQRLKAKAAPALWRRGLHWEQDFFARRIRDGLVRAQVMRHIQLEPSRQGLIGGPDSWPWYYCSDTEQERLRLRRGAGRPEPKWLLARRN